MTLRSALRIGFALALVIQGTFWASFYVSTNGCFCSAAGPGPDPASAPGVADAVARAFFPALYPGHPLMQRWALPPRVSDEPVAR